MPDGLSQKEFFMGFSVPRNKELMRIFKDLGMAEQLGFGVPRILESYDKKSFAFSDNFLRMTFLAQREVTPQVKKLILITSGEMTRQELQDSLALADRMNFLKAYLQPAIESGFIELTIPDKPNSRNQQYRLTRHGEEMKQ